MTEQERADEIAVWKNTKIFVLRGIQATGQEVITKIDERIFELTQSAETTKVITPPPVVDDSA